jgi:hypothetical protein
MRGKLGTHIRGNAVGYVALFIALGGTSYAATLPRNSVGNKQIKNNAVTSSKIRNASIKRADIAASALVRGPRGLQGPPGPTGTSAAGASVAGTLPSGATLRGRFDASNGAPTNQANDLVTDSISFGAQLAAPPTRVMVAPGATTAQCTGTVADPRAAPGFLCVYIGESAKAGAIDTIGEGAVLGATSRQGTGIVVVSNQNGSFGARGSWAVTAPS